MHTSLGQLQAVEIEINHNCNRACSYCPNSSLERKTKGMMSGEFYQFVLQKFADISFTGRISLDFYNEPMLHPQLERLISLTREVLPSTQLHLYSNGTLLTQEKFVSLENLGVARFVITRHEADVDSKKPYIFDETLKKLTKIQQDKLIYRDHTALRLFNRGGLLKHLGTGLALHPCHLPSHMMTVTVDGRILSCFEDFNEELVFGDLKTQNLIDIWNSEKYVTFRKNLKRGLRHLHSPCRNCNRAEVLPPFDT